MQPHRCSHRVRRASKLDALLESLADQRKRLANLVMTGGARPLHSASESRVPELFYLLRLVLRLADSLLLFLSSLSLHTVCGMSRGGDASALITTLVKHGADVNAKDNYEMTPMDRLSSNSVLGNAVLRKHGAVSGSQLPRGAPQGCGRVCVLRPG